MNLKKFTKAELISKINGIKSKNNDSNPTLFSSLMNSLLLLKGFLLKITLIALVIKVFKKYSIFRKLWTFFSFILYSIFGISLIDIYEIEILSKFFSNILEIFNKFNTNILELFGKKVEVPIESSTKMGSMNRIDQSSTTSKESNKIIERFNQIIHKEPIEVKETLEIQEENNPLYKNKYVIIGGILVLSCLSWYFYDDLKPLASSLWTTINAFRPGPKNNPDDSNGNIQGNSKTNLQSLKDKVYEQMYGKGDKTPTELRDARYDYFRNRYFNGKATDEEIEAKVIFDADNEAGPSTGKTIDLRNLSQAEIDRRRLLELNQVELDRREGLQEQLTGLRDITGNSFKEDSDAVISEIDAFLDYQDKSKFPKPEVAAGLYDVLRKRLYKLYKSDEKQYDMLTDNKVVNARIEKFYNLEGQIFGDVIPSQEVKATPSPGLNNYAYDDIALSTIQEQETWSEKALSPSVRSEILSPINLNEADLNAAVADLLIENVTLRSEIRNPQNIQTQPIPAQASSSSSGSEMSHFFPNPEAPKIPSTTQSVPKYQDPHEWYLENSYKPNEAALLEQIRNRRNETEVVSEPNIDIDPPAPEVTQVENKSGFASLMESIRNRGKNAATTSTQPETSGSSTIAENKSASDSVFESIRTRGKGKNVVAEPQVVIQTPAVDLPPVTSGNSIGNKPKLDSLWETIKARRNDKDVISSPNISNVGLQTPVQERLNTSPLVHKPSLTNMFDDTMNLFDDDPIDTGIDTSGSTSNIEVNPISLIDSLDKVKVDIDSKDHKLNFNFGGMEDKIKSVHTATNDGYIASFDYKGENTFPWDNRPLKHKYSQGTLIKDIFIIDKEDKIHNLYHQDSPKGLNIK
jgi:hypothetical protein